MADEGDAPKKDAIIKGLGIRRRSPVSAAPAPSPAAPPARAERAVTPEKRAAAPEKTAKAAEPADDFDPLADVGGSMDKGDEPFDPLADMSGGMAVETAPAPKAPEAKAEPEPETRDTSLGIRRRSPQPSERTSAAEAKPAARGDARRGRHEEPEAAPAPPPEPEGPKLGNTQADVILAGLLRLREQSQPWGEEPKKLPLPFPEEHLTLGKTHGFYHGDGTGQRLVKTGLRMAGVVFAVPPLVEVERDRLPAPVPTDEGFEVSPELNKLGRSYHYVGFVLPEGAERAKPKPKKPAAVPESGGRASNKMKDLRPRRRV